MELRTSTDNISIYIDVLLYRLWINDHYREIRKIALIKYADFYLNS